jgi:small conductance mechanosensitive channel
MDPLQNLQNLDQITTTAIDLGIKFAPKLLVAILILVAGYFAGRWAGRALGRALERARLEPPYARSSPGSPGCWCSRFSRSWRCRNLGVELLPLVAGLGIAGAGVALAMQGVLGNGIAGLTIMVTRPFKVGDFISVAGEQGAVEDITLFSTTLGHADMSKVGDPEPQDRRRDPAQLPQHPAARHRGRRVLQDRRRRRSGDHHEILRAESRALKDPSPSWHRQAARLVRGAGGRPVGRAADYGPRAPRSTRRSSRRSARGTS